MLFCRCREGVRVELALRLAPGIHGYVPYYVKIGLILPRLFHLRQGPLERHDPLELSFPPLSQRPLIRSLLDAAETTLSNAQV